MPTTLTGLLLFVVLLLPGFAYLVGKERHGTERHTLPFRETIAVVAASVTSEMVVLGLFAIIRWLRPTWTPDVGALIRNGSAYASGHYRVVAAWSFGMLVFATLFAYLATVPGVRRFFKQVLVVGHWCFKHIPVIGHRFFKRTPVIGTYPHDSTVSAWWLLFERWPGKRDIQVTCTLDDGWAIRGRFQSFNNSADDSPDRDLILKRPIEYRQPAETQWHDFNARYACLSARRIVTLFISYPPLAGAAGAPLAAQGNPSEGQPIVIRQP